MIVFSSDLFIHFGKDETDRDNGHETAGDAAKNMFPDSFTGTAGAFTGRSSSWNSGMESGK